MGTIFGLLMAVIGSLILFGMWEAGVLEDEKEAEHGD